MVRKFIALALLGTAGCGDLGSSSGSVAELLRTGDAKVCAHPAVKTALREKVTKLPRGHPLYSADEFADAATEIEPQITMAQAIKLKPDIGQAACSVSVAVGDMATEQPFTLRQSLEDANDFFISGDFMMASSLWQGGVVDVLAERFPNRRAELQRKSEALEAQREVNAQAEREEWAAKDPARWSCWQRVKESPDLNEKNACLTTQILSASLEEQEAWAAKDPERWACWQRNVASSDQTKLAACLSTEGYNALDD